MQIKSIVTIIAIFLTLWFSQSAKSQDNYEIQVYPSETIGKGYTMFELHSNVSLIGPLFANDASSNLHQFHETLEITHGFTPVFEVGFYQFVNLPNGINLQLIGNHIRPRIRIPDDWKFPVGLSFSAEIGYQNPAYSPDTWTLEIRPIIDKDFRTVYLSFNPTFGKSLKGVNENQPFDFEPSFKMAFHLNPKIDFGFEYYGATGSLFNSPSFQKQEHIIYAALDLNLHPDWELNLGTGWGLTDSTDRFMVKLILGHKFRAKDRSKRRE